MKDLKNCPCCGAKARIETSQAETAFKVSCGEVYKCGLTQYWFDNEEEAVKSWNRRID